MLPVPLLLPLGHLHYFFFILSPDAQEVPILPRAGIRDPRTENIPKVKRDTNKVAVCEMSSAGPEF